MAEQYDRGSPNFHHWLKPSEFGRLYGPSDEDIEQVSRWLRGYVFAVEGAIKGRTFLTFSGNAGQIQAAFHAEIHRYVYCVLRGFALREFLRSERAGGFEATEFGDPLSARLSV